MKPLNMKAAEPKAAAGPASPSRRRYSHVPPPATAKARNTDRL
jgi:hypothetical protein